MPDSETTTGAGKKIIADAKVGFAPKAGQVNTPEPGPVGGTAKKIFIGAVVIVAAGKGFLTRWLLPQPKALGPGFTSGNGRIKPTARQGGAISSKPGRSSRRWTPRRWRPSANRLSPQSVVFSAKRVAKPPCSACRRYRIMRARPDHTMKNGRGSPASARDQTSGRCQGGDNPQAQDGNHADC